ncbi:unnamed protein product [Didymodactylos carnosus]|uniref:Uncharacterized protein n=1 Tax=Didymodactylos carnosus TaxID=1234261 RepID=A0A814WUI2_9BILA|nr:unnamed protein product [Didymodactylos carnosus]CAF3971455.1 unnamed protein product [Didymodactylos carnosus]
MISGADILNQHQTKWTCAITTNEVLEEQQLMSNKLKNELKRAIYDGVCSSKEQKVNKIFDLIKEGLFYQLSCTIANAYSGLRGGGDGRDGALRSSLHIFAQQKAKQQKPTKLPITIPTIDPVLSLLPSDILLVVVLARVVEPEIFVAVAPQCVAFALLTVNLSLLSLNIHFTVVEPVVT